MGQKVHPYGFRLGYTKPWKSRWFVERDYNKLLLEDVKLKEELKDKLKSCVLLLAAVDGAKVSLIAGVSADLTSKVKAGELVNFVAQQVGGKGGGRPDMAQAGGTDASKLPEALKSVTGWVEQKL